MSFQNDLPKSLSETKTVQVLFSAIKENRCPHGILFYGASPKILEELCVALASEILGMPAKKCLDFHVVSPMNKSRTISMEQIHGLVREIQQSPSAGNKKVACVFDAERLGKDSANAFLKTLEEPPEGTFIFLTSTAVNRVISTILSRCLQFRIQGTETLDDPEWIQWKSDFEKWILSLTSGEAVGKNVAKTIFSLYALTMRLKALVETISDKAWEETKEEIPKTLSSEQKKALQDGAVRGVRRQVLSEIQDTILQFSLQKGAERSFIAECTQTCELLERLSRLLELNMKDIDVFEAFFLSCTRIWAKRPNSSSVRK